MSAHGGVFSPNQFFFSSCSIRGFKAYLLNENHLPSKNASCLLNIPKKNINFDKLSNKLPGEIWSVDDQCRHLYGMNYSFSREKSYRSII